MKNFLLGAVFFSAAAAQAAGQDILRFKDPKSPEQPCDVISLSFRKIEFDVDIGGQKNKTNTDAANVQEIVIDHNHKTFEFVSGETAMNSGAYGDAITRLGRVRSDSRASDLLKQTAAIYIVRCFYNLENYAEALAAIRALRQDKPESFYLKESYEIEIRSNLMLRNLNGASQAINALEAAGNQSGMTEWSKSADILRGSLLERQGKWREALFIHKRYLRDPQVGEDAILGELRCLKEVGDWSNLHSRGESLIIESKTSKKGGNPRVLTAAYNARGQAALNGGKIKEALLDFMEGVAVMSARGAAGTQEHECSLAYAAISCAKLAATLPDKAKKDLYKGRAQELQAELKKSFGSSGYLPEIQRSIQDVK